MSMATAPDEDLGALLEPEDWRTHETAHQQRADAFLAGRVARAARGEKHPVEDFLFTYYSLRPGRLRRWHPGIGVTLLGAADGERAGWAGHRTVLTSRGAGVTVEPAEVLGRRGGVVRFIGDLQRAIAGRAPTLDCFGLHEWAMVHGLGQDEVRHAAWPLRLSPRTTDQVVERMRPRCSHFDAFRFFTPSARPLNLHQPTRETQIDLDQPGCLHATMDLYKWSYKLGPLVPGALLLDSFELARDARELDMRASPYDLVDLGVTPIPIETPEGRSEYVRHQREIVRRGQDLRARLLSVCDATLSTLPGPSGE